MYLNTDIFSLMNKGHIYGRKGDVVTMVSDGNHVCIVEGPEGERFEVAKSELSEDKIEAAPDTAAPVIIPNPGAGVKKKAAPLNQSTLF